MSINKNTIHRLIKVSIISAIISIALIGCSTIPMDNAGKHRSSSSSSLVSYLYPNGERPPGLALDIPQLTVPVRLGIAFVPNASDSSVLSHAVKNRLLRKVKRAFKHHTVVREIRLIPTSSLTHQGGFSELRRVAIRYNVDLVALVSHNQVRAISNNALSISYLTIVGALILPGNNHRISTFVDTAVFDVDSAKLLFRAAGKDRIRRQSSAFALAEKNRYLSQNSMNKATGAMISSLNTELNKFRSRIRRGSNEADVHYRRGYKGNRYRGSRSGGRGRSEGGNSSYKKSHNDSYTEGAERSREGQEY